MSVPELLGLLGGPDRVLLVGAGPSGSKARLQAFARELFREEEGEKEKGKLEEEEEEKKESEEGGKGKEGCNNGAAASFSRREVRVSLGWSSSPSSGGRPPLLPLSPAGLAVVLFGAPSLLLPGERRLLREILRDLRLRLDSASRQRPPVAVVGVAALQKDPGGGEDSAGSAEEEARSQLQALLRRTFGGGGRVQAALHRPGRGAREVREAACRALRGLRSRQTDEVETKKQKLPLFFKCLPWGRRRQQRKGHLGTDANKFNEDTPQDQDEGLALT